MKRQHKSWLIAVLAVLAAAMVLTGCSLKEVKSLTITNPPATTYVKGTTPSLNFTVEAVMDDDSTKTLTYNEYSSVLKLTGFSTEEVGSFTATVTYRNVSATFDYEVVEASEDFAGGVGTETNPYIINTAKQFKKIGNPGYEGKYFKLNADLTFTDAEKNSLDCIVDTFSGVLDGGGYKITIENSNPAYSSCMGLFSTLVDATVKNVDVYSSGFVTIAVNCYKTVTISNVDRYGEMVFEVGNNLGAFVIYVYNGGRAPYYADTNFLMENCENHVNMSGTAQYVSGFVGYPLLTDNGRTSIVLRNCVNYGNLSGQKMSAFFANAAQVLGRGIVMENCWNEGTIMTTDESDFVFAVSAHSVIGEKDSNGNPYPEYVVGKERVELVVQENCGHRNGGSQEQIAPRDDYTASVITTEENKNLILVETISDSEVAYAVVRASYYASGTGGTGLHSTWEVVDLTTVSSGHTTRVWKTEVIAADDVAESTTEGESWSLNTEGQYVHFDSEYPNASGTVTVYVMVFNAAGELIGGSEVK